MLWWDRTLGFDQYGRPVRDGLMPPLSFRWEAVGIGVIIVIIVLIGMIVFIVKYYPTHDRICGREFMNPEFAGTSPYGGIDAQLRQYGDSYSPVWTPDGEYVIFVLTCPPKTGPVINS